MFYLRLDLHMPLIIALAFVAFASHICIVFMVSDVMCLLSYSGCTGLRSERDL